MSLLPKTRIEEKVDIWFEEALQRADRGFEMDKRGFIVFNQETLHGLIEEIIDDVMPSDSKNMTSLSLIRPRCKRLATIERTLRG